MNERVRCTLAREALTLSNVNAFYGDSHILHGVGFSLTEGHVLALLGRNGAGKTTCISTIVGFLTPKEGDIRLFDEAIGGLSPERISRLGIGLVPQGRRIFPSLTVRENLIVARQRENAAAKPWNVERIFELFPRLQERHAQFAGTLSGGEQQMLAIGRALMGNPRVLLLDEPSEGLAPLIVAEVGRTIKRLKEEGQSIVLVEQNRKLALEVADQAVILNTGRCVFAGEASEITEELITQHLGVYHAHERSHRTEVKKMKVGVCGTGRMGASIAQRLIAVGHEVGVWNRDATKTKPLTDAGAKLYASPAALAGGCEAVYRPPNGLLKAELAGKLIIDMSTVRPDTMISVGSAVALKGAGFVECPVGGSTVPAREGKLFGLVGGTNADVARAMPLLEQLCRRIEHVGALGAGATMKLAVNLPLLVYWQALGEALTICKPLNLPAERLIDIPSDTAGAPAAMKGRGAIIAKVLGGAPLGGTAFGITAAKKDLATAVPFAASLHAELPVAKTALACFEEAEADGLGEAEATTVSVHWTRRKPRS